MEKRTNKMMEVANYKMEVAQVKKDKTVSTIIETIDKLLPQCKVDGVELETSVYLTHAYGDIPLFASYSVHIKNIYEMMEKIDDCYSENQVDLICNQAYEVFSVDVSCNKLLTNGKVDNAKLDIIKNKIINMQKMYLDSCFPQIYEQMFKDDLYYDFMIDSETGEYIYQIEDTHLVLDDSFQLIGDYWQDGDNHFERKDYVPLKAKWTYIQTDNEFIDYMYVENK